MLQDWGLSTKPVEEVAPLPPHAAVARAAVVAAVALAGGVRARSLARKLDPRLLARRTFLTSVRHDLLTCAIVLDDAVTIPSMKVFLHRCFHALNAMMIEIGETDDVTEHYAVGINAGCVLFEIDAA